MKHIHTDADGDDYSHRHGLPVTDDGAHRNGYAHGHIYREGMTVKGGKPPKICIYCNEVIEPQEERVWRGIGRWGHKRCWEASDDGA